MENIVYFYESQSASSAVRFVKTFREKRWYRRGKLSYTFILAEALPFASEDLAAKCENLIREDFPNARIYVSNYDEFRKLHRDNLFWFIGKFDERNEIAGYFSRLLRAGKKWYCEWTAGINDAELHLLERQTQEDVMTIRRTTGEKVAAVPIYANLQNIANTPCMMIICHNKRDDKQMKYFSRQEGNRLRLVTTSQSAAKFSIQGAVDKREELMASNKNFLYSILPAFEDNIRSVDIETYVERKHISTAIPVTFKLRHISLGESNTLIKKC